MTLRLDWIANINVIINTAVLQSPTFNNCMIMGVFPLASLPTSWSGTLAHAYSDYASVSADFTPLYNAAVTATSYVQAYKYAILLKGAELFFTQAPVPTVLYVGCIDNTSTVNYVNAIQDIVNANNNFYAFYIADQVTATQVNQTNGIKAALTAQTSARNFKMCFLDTNNPAITTGNFLYDVTALGIGSQRMMLWEHPSNPVSTTVTTAAAVGTTLAPAAMGAFFTTLFTSAVGLKSFACQQLIGVAADTTLTNTNLGTPGTGDGILGVNGNVYPAVGSSGIGLCQYGLMASSTASALLYADQVIGADYINSVVQTDFVNFIISKQPTGGVPYSDSGIQLLLNTFRGSLNKAVNQNIIQPFSNSAVTAVPYSQVSSGDKTARIYNGLAASLLYVGNIQRLSASVNLSPFTFT